jgi:hypothetical protein
MSIERSLISSTYRSASYTDSTCTPVAIASWQKHNIRVYVSLILHNTRKKSPVTPPKPELVVSNRASTSRGGGGGGGVTGSPKLKLMALNTGWKIWEIGGGRQSDRRGEYRQAKHRHARHRQPAPTYEGLRKLLPACLSTAYSHISRSLMRLFISSRVSSLLHVCLPVSSLSSASL